MAKGINFLLVCLLLLNACCNESFKGLLIEQLDSKNNSKFVIWSNSKFGWSISGNKDDNFALI